MPVIPVVVPSDVALQNVRRRTLMHPFGEKQERVRTDTEIRTQNEEVKLKLRRHIGYFAMILTGLQVVCAYVVFIVYAADGLNWKVPTAAIESWLAATVIQVIGIVLVITRSLFPSKDETTTVPSL
jgi:hypothetical protein